MTAWQALKEMFNLVRPSSKKQEKLWIMFGLYAGLLVAIEAAVPKIINWPWLGTAPVTVAIFMLTYTITDIVAEEYGRLNAFKITLVAMITLCISMVSIRLCVWWPWWAVNPPTFLSQYDTVLSYGTGAMLGTIVAFPISQIIDTFTFIGFKQMTWGKWLWMRNNLSTFIGNFVNQMLFVLFGLWLFAPVVPTIAANTKLAEVLVYWNLVFGGLWIKLLLTVVTTPFTYLGVWWIRKSQDYTPDTSWQAEGRIKLGLFRFGHNK